MSEKLHDLLFDDTVPYSAVGTENDDYLTASTYIIGLGGNDTLVGVDGGQHLDGGEGNDYLFGGEGDDTLIGGTGNDTIDGGGGIDSYDLSLEESGLSIDLAGGLLQSGVYRGDTLRNLESLTATYFDDTIYGSSGADIINGVSGVDYIDGKSGNDYVISMGDGNYSTLHGGDGDDTVSGFGVSYGDAGNDTVFGDVAYGGDGDDELDGRILYGGAGNDFSTLNQVEFFDGGDGDDTGVNFYGSSTMLGGSGNDTYYSSGLEQLEADRDHVELGDGADTALINTYRVEGAQVYLDGGDGFDVLRFFMSSVFDPYDLDLRALDSEAITIAGYTFKDFESLYWLDTSMSGRVGLTDGDDVVIAPTTRDLTLHGYLGDDTLNAGGANVKVYGGDGDNLIAGVGYSGSEPSNKSVRYGEDGNDILLWTEKAVLFGGSGQDIFGLAAYDSWAPSSERAEIIRDFESGVDKVGYIASEIFDSWIDERPSVGALRTKVFRDDEDMLVFKVKGTHFKMAYDRDDGEFLVVDGVMKHDVYGDVLAKFKGAPDIGIKDFVFLT